MGRQKQRKTTPRVEKTARKLPSRVRRASTTRRKGKKAEVKPEEILAYLKRLAPAVGRISVESPDPSKNMLLLPLAKVCYITSKTDSDREDETMFVTVDGEKFYNSMSLTALSNLFRDGNPWFLQTSKYYIVNLSKVTAYRFSSARDLWFAGFEKPVENAVSDMYLAEFNARIGI